MCSVEILQMGNLERVLDEVQDSEIDYEEAVIRSSEDDDVFVIQDPVVYLPGLNLFTASITCCDQDLVADWCGTILFGINNEDAGIEYYGYESDGFLTTLYNFTHLPLETLITTPAMAFFGGMSRISMMLEREMYRCSLQDQDRDIEQEFPITVCC